MERLDNQRLQNLCRALISCADSEELMEKFLKDLLAHKELTSVTNRWTAAIHISLGWTDRQIEERLSISHGTTDRVRKCVINGAGGYTTALQRRKDTSS